MRNFNFLQSENAEQSEQYMPTSQSKYVAFTLAFVGGFLEVYTYTLKGGVFCNAQTGNMVFIGVNLVNGNFFKALYFLMPLIAYCLGILLTLVLPKAMGSGVRFRRETLILCIEIIVLFLIGFETKHTPRALATVPIAFICALQYNAFNDSNGVKLATVFCTNNWRQFVILMYNGLKSNNKQKVRKSLYFLSAILMFFGGIIIGAVACRHIGEKAIWICSGLEIPMLAFLLYDNNRKRYLLKKLAMQASRPEQ